MIQELLDIFPNLTERKIWKMLLTLKMRYKKYGVVGFSRLEATRFGTSERQLQAFIKFLRDNDCLRKARMVKCANNSFKCNVYSLSELFIKGLEDVKDFVKKTFEYIDPVSFVKSRFEYKTQYGKIKFKVNGDRYIIHLRGKFAGKIFDVGNNCIINPLLLG